MQEEQAIEGDANLMMAEDEQKRVEASNKEDKQLDREHELEKEIDKAAIAGMNQGN